MAGSTTPWKSPHKLVKVTLYLSKSWVKLAGGHSISKLPPVTGMRPSVFQLMVTYLMCTVKITGLAAFPCASTAVQTTFVSPTWKRLPDAGVHVAVPAPSTMSVVAGGVNLIIPPANCVEVEKISE